MDALARLISADVVGHEPTQQLRGFDAFKSNIETWLYGHSEPRIATEDLFACGDRAAWRWKFDGTHTATGRPLTVEGIIIFRFDRGRIAERDVRRDAAAATGSTALASYFIDQRETR